MWNWLMQQEPLTLALLWIGVCVVVLAVCLWDSVEVPEEWDI